MPELKVGDSLPKDVSFTYIPFTSDKASIGACGIPVKYDASKEWQNKKVVLVAVPGAFTPTCSERHVPGFLDNQDKLKAKGVDHVVVIAMNDVFVMSAWGKANQVTDDFTLFMADDGLKFSKSIGWVTPDGSRSSRYAIVIDHGKITYAEQDVPKALDKSSAEAVLAKL